MVRAARGAIFGLVLIACASATSALLLFVFIVVNGALVVLKRRPSEPRGVFEVPIAVPIGGMLVCFTLLWSAKPEALGIAAILLAGITALYFVHRPRNITEESLAEMGD